MSGVNVPADRSDPRKLAKRILEIDRVSHLAGGICAEGVLARELLAALDREAALKEFGTIRQRRMAEARADTLRDALRRIASSESLLSTPGVLDNSFSGQTAQAQKKIAREALAAAAGSEEK